MKTFPSIDRTGLTVIFCLRTQVCRRAHSGGGFCEGPAAGFKTFLKAVDAGARRQLTFMMGSCSHVTADEMALLNLLADAQNENIVACNIRARWIAKAPYTDSIVDAAREAAAGLLEIGVELPTPTLIKTEKPVVLRAVPARDLTEVEQKAHSVGV